MARSSFYAQVSANKRNSLLLAVVITALLAALGFTIGYAVSGSPTGGVFAIARAIAVGAVSGVALYYSGDKLVLAVSVARESIEADARQLMNGEREMAIAANDPRTRVHEI